MLQHIRHIYQVGGEDVLALGTDFDGIEGKLQIKSCDELYKLREALLQVARHLREHLRWIGCQCKYRISLADERVGKSHQHVRRGK